MSLSEILQNRHPDDSCQTLECNSSMLSSLKVIRLPLLLHPPSTAEIVLFSHWGFPHTSCLTFLSISVNFLFGSKVFTFPSHFLSLQKCVYRAKQRRLEEFWEHQKSHRPAPSCSSFFQYSEDEFKRGNFNLMLQKPEQLIQFLQYSENRNQLVNLLIHLFSPC